MLVSHLDKLRESVAVAILVDRTSTVYKIAVREWIGGFQSIARTRLDAPGPAPLGCWTQSEPVLAVHAAGLLFYST